MALWTTWTTLFSILFSSDANRLGYKIMPLYCIIIIDLILSPFRQLCIAVENVSQNFYYIKFLTRTKMPYIFIFVFLFFYFCFEICVYVEYPQNVH